MRITISGYEERAITMGTTQPEGMAAHDGVDRRRKGDADSS